METRNKEILTFPKSVLIIIILEFVVKFTYTGIRGTLPLYIVDTLRYKETEATVLYHSWTSSIYFFTLLGGIVSDSWMGKFRSILYASVALILGLLLLIFSSVRPLNLPMSELTILGLIICAIAFGMMRPCISTFGGDQFVLPDQTKYLSMMFVGLCVAHNVGSLSSSFIIPVLRKDITCFGELTCYSLAFMFPAILIAATTVVFALTKRLYQISKPTNNVLVDCTNCISYALYRKLKSKDECCHWLDYASDKYKRELIEDIKSVSNVLTLFLPLTVFWALLGMQTSTWTFQASRMNGDVGGYVIKPDQIHAFNPLCVIVFAPIFHSYVYPVIGKYCFLNTPLRKATVGCLFAAVAYFVSGIVEYKLESTYAVTPISEFGQLRIYNTLNCNVLMKVNGKSFILKDLDMWSNINIPVKDTKSVKYEADFRYCDKFDFSPNPILGNIEVMEKKAISVGITAAGLKYKFIDNIDKSMSGNPLVRSLIYVDKNISTIRLVLKFKNNNEELEQIVIPTNFKESEYKEVAHKTYDLYLNDQLIESNVSLRLGGVYTVVGYVNSNTTATTRTVTVTQPNSLHILWILPQEIILAFSEIMVDIVMTEFVFSQAPTSMKALIQACFLFNAVFSNIIIITVAEINIFERKTYKLFFFAFLMTISTVIFSILSTFYKYKTNQENPEKNIKNTDNTSL